MNTPCLQAATAASRTRRPFFISLAHSHDDVMECQRLRYRVFAHELGARIQCRVPGLDRDRFDAYCHHVMVRNQASGELVATTRLLLDQDAMDAGMFYSETEFDLTPVLRLNGRFMEVGRTCIHPAHRKGLVLAMVWHGIARMIDLHRIDYLIGCASIPLANGPAYVASVMERLREHHFAKPDMRLQPRNPLPLSVAAGGHPVSIPTLLKGYLRQGAVICGEPHHDADFGVADVPVLLDRDRIARRYRRHFMQRM
ncbi:MAG: GNAT family N-acyltransferase [Gammaproteobacteria bacterium]